ncbi:MAG: CPBP family intramembrane metalloprotease [Kiritimatiellae bacterium]|nr:CPBP family intramembrane metalloprotease [Kiritimatiellia bacterium]
MRHMTPPATKYGPLHALAAGAVLVYAVLSNGFAAFWYQFLHGLSMQLNEKTILPLLAMQTLFFGGLFLILWISTLFHGRNKRAPPSGGSGVSPLQEVPPGGSGVSPLQEVPPGGSGVPPLHPPLREAASRRFTITLTLLSAIPICLIALGLNWACGELLSRLADVDLSDQELVKFLTSSSLSLRGKVILFSFLLIEAPLLEELLFRGVLFGGLTKIMPVWGAMLLSGFLFAVIHVNAATLIPLWFLGVAFAWLYARTGTLLAPMVVHLTFNAVNLTLCLLF